MSDENNELTIKKERVLAAAAKCPTADGILREIFPEVFRESPQNVTKLAYLDTWPSDKGPRLLLCVNDNDTVGYDASWYSRACLVVSQDGKVTPLPEENKSGDKELYIKDGELWRRKT